MKRNKFRQYSIQCIPKVLIKVCFKLDCNYNKSFPTNFIPPRKLVDWEYIGRSYVDNLLPIIDTYEGTAGKNNIRLRNAQEWIELKYFKLKRKKIIESYRSKTYI